MILNDKQFEQIVKGAYKVEKTEDGYYNFFRYTDQQLKYLEFDEAFHMRAQHSSCISLEFETRARNISFEVKFENIATVDSIDIYVNDFLYQTNLVSHVNKTGKIECRLPKCNKKVAIYLSIDSKTYVKNFEIDGEYTPISNDEKVLWIGDSITQGYGSLVSGTTYVNTANRYLRYDILVQGIGGYYYDYGDILMQIDGFKPDKIIVALGTNNPYDETFVSKVERFYEKLVKLFENTPVLVITPICKYNYDGAMQDVRNKGNTITEICNKFENITVVDGLTLVPNTPDMFLDKLHLNTIGNRYYAESLVRFIREIDF